MKPENDVTVKWNERRLLLPSALIGVVCLALLLAIGERAKPPEGHVFERMAPISGIYHCCGGGGRTSWSSVGHANADCASMEYFPFTGVNWHDCGYKEELNGKVVEIERVIVPTLFPEDAGPVVVKLSSGGKTYIEYSDQTFRQLWIDRMRGGELSTTLSIVLIFHLVQLVYFNRKSQKKSKK
jgi:hypothetical protein